jgi:hypothetical protein
MHHPVNPSAAVTLELENHCKSRLDPGRHPWALGCGFIHTAWIDEAGEVLDAAPRPGESRRLHVGKPFHARKGEPFHVLWEPAIVVHNGWEEDYQARLSEVRIVTCRFVDILGPCTRAVGWSPSEGFDLRVDVLACVDPMTVEAGAGDLEVGLSAWPFAEGQRLTLNTWRASDRILVTGSVESDINLDLLVDPNVERVAMLIDTSICENFFWFGAARASKELRDVLVRLLG